MDEKQFNKLMYEIELLGSKILKKLEEVVQAIKETDCKKEWI